MIANRYNRSVRPARAFTLVEVLLVILLLALLAAFTWPLFQGDSPRQKIERSANRLSSLLAMCRAEAMLQGHPYRVTWPTATQPAADSTAPIQPQIVHEADPANSPGQYNPVAASWAQQPVFDPGVQLQLIQPGAFDISSLVDTKGRFSLPPQPSLPNVQFQPDGTADAAVFVLTAQIAATGDPQQDELQFWIVVDGMTGLTAISEPPAPSQYDDMLAEQTELPDLQFQEQTVEVTLPNQLTATGTGTDQMTLASLLSGGAGGASALSNSNLQSILSQLQPLLSGKGGASTTGTGIAATGAGTARNSGAGANTGRNASGTANTGGRNTGGTANTGGRNTGGSTNTGGRNTGGTNSGSGNSSGNSGTGTSGKSNGSGSSGGRGASGSSGSRSGGGSTQ